MVTSSKDRMSVHSNIRALAAPGDGDTDTVGEIISVATTVPLAVTDVLLVLVLELLLLALVVLVVVVVVVVVVVEDGAGIAIPTK